MVQNLVPHIVPQPHQYWLLSLESGISYQHYFGMALQTKDKKLKYYVSPALLKMNDYKK